MPHSSQRLAEPQETITFPQVHSAGAATIRFEAVRTRSKRKTELLSANERTLGFAHPLPDKAGSN